MSADWTSTTTTTETPAREILPEPSVTYLPPPAWAPVRRAGPVRRGLRAVARAMGRMGWRLNLLLALGALGTMYIAHGPVYAVSAFLILGAHEMGHYVWCRRHGVDATLPYFLPAPPPFLFGTFGAVIRIRPPIPGRRALFDIGIAGPIAGFLVAVPVIAYGVATSPVIPWSPDAFEFGDPLLIKILMRILHGPLPEGATLVMNPALLAGWFGLLVTTMNLFPVAHLDGGHISYALSPRTHRDVARFVTTAMVALVLVSLGMGVVNGWALWTIVLFVVARFGHPPVDAAHEPLGATRIALAVGAALIFVLSFMPLPVQIPLPW